VTQQALSTVYCATAYSCVQIASIEIICVLTRSAKSLLIRINS